MKNKSIIPVTLSVVLSFVFVAVAAYASTTISTSITTGGALNADGASTLNGNVTLGDAVTDVVTITGYISMPNNYALVGTTTQSGLSILTLEATSTAAIPLTIRGYNGQVADLFRIHNVAGTKLFSISASGNASLANASTTALTTTGNVYVNGFATTTASNGYILTGGFLGVGSTTAATTELTVDSASATSTVNVASSSAVRGGCIQIEGANNTTYRIWIGDATTASTTGSGRVGFVVFAEAGTCK